MCISIYTYIYINMYVCLFITLCMYVCVCIYTCLRRPLNPKLSTARAALAKPPRGVGSTSASVIDQTLKPGTLNPTCSRKDLPFWCSLLWFLYIVPEKGRSFRLQVDLKHQTLPAPPKCPLIEPFWSLIGGILGILEGSWGV